MTSKERFENLCPEDLDAWITVSHTLEIDLHCTKVKFITIYHRGVSLILYCTMYILFLVSDLIQTILCNLHQHYHHLFRGIYCYCGEEKKGDQKILQLVILFFCKCLVLVLLIDNYLVRFATVPFHANWLSTR